MALLTGYNKGIISGSTVDSRQGCQPFSMLYARGRESSKCTNQCPGMGRLFSEDKVVEPWAKLFDVPKILGNYLRMPWQKRWSDDEVVTAMMRDIQQNGSIVASIKNGPSFNLYGGGIFLVCLFSLSSNIEDAIGIRQNLIAFTICAVELHKSMPQTMNRQRIVHAINRKKFFFNFSF